MRQKAATVWNSPTAEPVEVKDGKITFTVKPYEIKTIRIR